MNVNLIEKELPASHLKFRSEAVTETLSEDAPKPQALLGVWNQQNLPFGLTYASPDLPEAKHMSIVYVLPEKLNYLILSSNRKIDQKKSNRIKNQSF